MEWKEAIIKVLQAASDPMTLQDIAEEISQKNLRAESELGATPSSTVASILAQSLKNDSIKSPFVRVSRGVYALRERQQKTETPAAGIAELSVAAEPSRVSSVINAFGMYWDRAKVRWVSEPSLWGKQTLNSKPVDFGKQNGIYLLHDPQGVLYVGRVIDQSLGKRLNQHTVDRHTGRWTRFSWFGVYPVQDDGSLNLSPDFSAIKIDQIIVVIESLLIEALEPRQNRRRGDDVQAAEYLQHEDPEISEQRKKEVLKEALNSYDRSR